MKVKFGSGDKVFAKVRGYPFWPAWIVGPQDESASKIKYDIVFYGTGEKAVVKAEDVHPFLEKRHELGRPKKQKAFNDAMAEIESELSPEELAKSGGFIDEQSGDDAPAKRKYSVGRPSKQSVEANFSESASTPNSENRASRGRKRKSRFESDVETANDVTSQSSSGRKIKDGRLSLDSPSRNKASVTKIKRPIDRLKDRYEFDYNGATVYLPLDLNRPSLSCPKNMVDWINLVSEKASELKDDVIQGVTTLEEAKSDMDEFTRFKAKEKKKEYEENERYFKVLKVEGKLLQLDVKIKASLTLTKANPTEACKHLVELLSLPITALMLKKHPEIVHTFKRLSHYVGNTTGWSMSDGEKALFSSQAGNVRIKAQLILDKFKYLFNVPEGQSFSLIFSRQLRDFNLATQKLSQDDFFSLVKEPVLGLKSQGVGTKSL